MLSGALLVFLVFALLVLFVISRTAVVVPQQAATIEATILDNGKVHTRMDGNEANAEVEPLTSPADAEPASAALDG